MSKSVISKTTELTKLRTRYSRSNIAGSFFVGLAVLAVYFGYIFMAISLEGYVLAEPLIDTSIDWVYKVFVYFDTTKSLFDFDGLRANPIDLSNIWRIVVLIGVVILSVVLAILYGVVHGRRLHKKYAAKYEALLTEEVRINGLTIESKVAVGEQIKIKTDLTRANVDKPVCSKKSIIISSPSFSWDGIPYEYKYNNKVRDGFLIHADIDNPRASGLIQFRTYGRPSMAEFENNEIKKYGFAENPKMSEYVCYTSLGQDIYSAIDNTVADALYDFKQYVGCGIVVTLASNSLSIFIDGFKLSLIKTLKDHLDVDFLERQATAIAALHKCVGAIVSAFSADKFVVTSSDTGKL